MNYNTDMLLPALKIIFSLGIVVAVLLAGLYIMKQILQKKLGSSKGELITILASTSIGIKKNITLVNVSGTILVLGVTNDNITFLTKIDNREVAEDNAVSVKNSI